MTDRPSLEDLDAPLEPARWCCGGNAEDCVLCTDPNLPYPFLCPGHPRTAANERIVGETVQPATEATELDKTQLYLVPVAHLALPDEPDVVHLAQYSWQDRLEAWVTGLAICGRSAEQGPLLKGTDVSCAGCLKWRPVYEQVQAGHNNRHQLEAEARRQQDLAGDTVENGAWFTVWLEGNWSWVTSKMTTPQREYAADCVAAYSRYLETVDGAGREGEPEGLRWWREDTR